MNEGRKLEGRSIIVTGAASGMGAAAARRLTREGARLLLLDIAAEPLAALAAETDQPALTCDVSSEQDIDRAVAHAIETLGAIDGIVNAAGILRQGGVGEMAASDLHALLGVNLVGPILLCRAALPHLQRRPGSTIVNISSMAALRPAPGMAFYAASKAGLVGFAQTFAAEIGPNVRINTVCPGMILTPMTEFMNTAEGVAIVKSMTQLQRAGTVEEIADLVVFLSGAESSYISVAVVPINGGQSI